MIACADGGLLCLPVLAALASATVAYLTSSRLSAPAQGGPAPGGSPDDRDTLDLDTSTGGDYYAPSDPLTHPGVDGALSEGTPRR